jgi:hypothetical protein
MGFTRRCKKNQETSGSYSASSPLPFPTVGEGHRYLRKKKHTQTTVDFNFLSCSRICFFFFFSIDGFAVKETLYFGGRDLL